MPVETLISAFSNPNRRMFDSSFLTEFTGSTTCRMGWFCRQLILFLRWTFYLKNAPPSECVRNQRSNRHVSSSGVKHRLHVDRLCRKSFARLRAETILRTGNDFNRHLLQKQISPGRFSHRHPNRAKFSGGRQMVDR